MKDTIKIFISYAHKDKQYLDDFEKHIDPVKQKYSLEIFQDSQINAGEKFQHKIDENLDKSDIVLFFVSANSLGSQACKREKEQSLILKSKRNIVFIPIILSTCQWKETELKDFLATPEDGKPIDDFQDKNKAWNCVIDSLKKSFEQIEQIRKIQIKEDFKKVLQDIELLTRAHHNKNEVLLEDIFIDPMLESYDETRSREHEEDIEYSKLEDDILIHRNIVIAGENQSGKTTLCKKLFLALKKKGWLPVYVFDKDKKMKGIISNRIDNAFKEQYDIPKEVNYQELANRIIPIIDNFHLVKEKEKHIAELDATYSFSILTLDDIFDLNIENKNIIKNFKHFKIREFSHTLRDKLIQKWLQLKDADTTEDYQELDEKTEQVNSTLGKIINKGIVPSYPVFIITILSTYETANPLNENITSQGHCYQALIYIALRKKIQNEDIDIYLNFLTTIAYEFFKSKKRYFTQHEIEKFIEQYKQQYNLPKRIEEKLLLSLQEVKILEKNSFNSISFVYEYLYYYFVAKHIAENIDENKKNINFMMNNLHKNGNAYIVIFIVHHSKSNYVLDEIFINSLCLFHKYDPVTLEKNEVSFLDDKAEYIFKASLHETDQTPKYNRKRELERKDEIEKSQTDEEELDIEDENELSIEIKRSVKTVEVIGSIIKNRSGSLEKKRLKELFEEAMNVHFRLLKFLLEIIEKDEAQESIIDFIKSRVEKIKKTNREITQDELKELSRRIFWNLIFAILYGSINKIVRSLGSNNLINIISEVCDKINTPASFLVKHGVFMWYLKDLQVYEIAKKIKEENFSATSRNLIKFMIAHHCSMHGITYKDRQKLESKLGFPSRKLLKANLKARDND